MAQNMVLKLSQHSQKQELTLAKLVPGIATAVFWMENVMVVLHDDKGGMQNLAMTLLCQQPVVKAVEVMAARGALFSFKFPASLFSDPGTSFSKPHAILNFNFFVKRRARRFAR